MWFRNVSIVCAVLATVGCVCLAQAEETGPKEEVFTGELLSYPGAWSFQIPRHHIIVVSDAQLEALSNPDQVVDLSLTHDKREQSLRQVCEQARGIGARTLIIAFDHFFSQYRKGADSAPRKLMPDTQEYIDRIAAISKFAGEYGLGLELSLLTPLEIGPGYAAETGESGLWMHYRKGIRDPKSGDYSVELWRQTGWSNNKGPVVLKDAGVRVFAFRERGVPGASCRAVDPSDIVEITDTAKVQIFEGLRRGSGEYGAVRVRVHGTGGGDGRDKVLVVQQYHTPEMDYFSENALPYLQKLCDRYADAGVRLNALYSDEMHIQQDWHYFSHHDNGTFALRYVSPGFQRRFAEKYGAEYGDFAKYMIYFTTGQEDAANDLTAKQDITHVFGGSPEEIQRTALFRSRYYRMLQDGVVDLFTAAKRHMEGRMGRLLEARAHATWAESPTIDKWETGRQPHQQHQYEYTPNFVWSCTVHQAAAACQDYFKWGDFLTGNGNDHAEGGWLDRNYMGLSLACSTGIINRIPYSYGAHWGMPAAVNERRDALVNAFGAAGAPYYDMTRQMRHRDVGVLMLYPLDLVAVNERFGSWMVQYAYANMITQAKLVELGRVENGAILLGGRRFTTLAALFEPFPSKQFLSMVKEFVSTGGKLVWSGPPPVLDTDGDSALAPWSELMGVGYTPGQDDGILGPGRTIAFGGTLARVPPMTVLTHFTVDRLYPITPGEGVETVASSGRHVLGALKHHDGGGLSLTLGFRPRDDQSASLGYESRQWFELLTAIGAYPATGKFPDVNDNTEYLSRTTPYLCCRFPDGTVAVAPHLRDVEECWPGGFAREKEKDDELMKGVVLPTDRTELAAFKVNGREVTYSGRLALSFNSDDGGNLSAFAGMDCDRITINGKETVFADKKMPLVAWAPVEQGRQVENGAVMILFYWGEGLLTLPAPDLPEAVAVVCQGALPGSRGEVMEHTLGNGVLTVKADAAHANRWIYVTSPSH